MLTLLKAGAGIAIAALIAGAVPPLSPAWRAVAADLHQAEPQARMKTTVAATLRLLLQQEKG